MGIRKNITKGVTFNSGKKQSSFTLGGKGLSFKVPLTKSKKLGNESSGMLSKILGWFFTIIGGSFICLMIYVQIKKFFKDDSISAKPGSVSIALSHVKLHNKKKHKYRKMQPIIKDRLHLDTIKY